MRWFRYVRIVCAVGSLQRTFIIFKSASQIRQVTVGSRTQDRSKVKHGLMRKDIRSSGSDNLQQGKEDEFTNSDQPRGKTKSRPSFTSLLQTNLFRETVFSLLQLVRKQENRDYRMEPPFQHYSVEVKSN
jgi:hypothetical protein